MSQLFLDYLCILFQIIVIITNYGIDSIYIIYGIVVYHHHHRYVVWIIVWYGFKYFHICISYIID